IYDLSPFARPREALSTEGASELGLVRVEIHALHVAGPKNVVVSVVRTRGDLLDAGIDAFVDSALALGPLVGAKLYVAIAGRERANKVDITAKDGRNVVEMDREDAPLAAAVRAYFLARGILRQVSRSAGDAHAPRPAPRDEAERVEHVDP